MSAARNRVATERRGLRRSGGVQVAACACQPIEPSETNYLKFQVCQI